MDEFIVIVEEGEMRHLRVRKVFHGNNSFELVLKLFEDVYVLGYFLTISIPVSISQIIIAVAINIV